MSITELYSAYNIQFMTEGHSHCRPGWVNIPCPFCSGNQGYHLGFNIEKNFYTCYRCGYHTIYDVMEQILHTRNIRPILKQYDIFHDKSVVRVEPKIVIRMNKLKVPYGIVPMQRRHISYLQQRGFLATQIEDDWNVQGTNHLSKYKGRLFIPIHYKGEMVSFTTRDITGKAEARYISCASEQEVVPHKSILYGIDHAPGTSCIVVEGVTGVWRIGFGTVATFGVKYTTDQVNLLAKFKKVTVIFDPDEAGKLQGRKLISDLRFRGVSCSQYELKNGDPGELSYAEVEKIRELSLKKT